ncbi:MAG: MBL fold metallo-hydrolase [Christensenellaceae bacterium]|nr:MBL fold metallo-hydrolase [Christensenellaceae bacterium]
MKIKWIAHSCFVIELKDTRKITFDPFDSSIGYECPMITADIACITHDHFDHNEVSKLSPGCTVLSGPGKYEFDGVTVTGIHTFHDKEHGALRGDNTVYVIEADGMRLVHFGDIGEIPDESFFKELGKVDIALIPVGGVYTIDGDEAYELVKIIEPNIVIPMHYKTLSLTTPLDSVQKFLSAAGGYIDVSRLGNYVFEIEAANLKKRSRIIVMQPALD